MKENDLNKRIVNLKERLNRMKNAHILPTLPVDKSYRTEQQVRPVKKVVYKKYNFESKL